MLGLTEEVEFNRYTYLFENEINPETVQNLIDTLVGVPSADLFFCTVGGELPAMKALIHFINNHPDIVIYVTGYLASAGTFLLTDCNKEIYLTEDLDFILFHQADRPVEGQFRKRKIDEKILYLQTEEVNKQLADKYKRLGLNSKEIKEYFKGEDVILYRKDFSRLKVNRK